MLAPTHGYGALAPELPNRPPRTLMWRIVNDKTERHTGTAPAW